MIFKEEYQPEFPEPSKVRQGRFLWMDEEDRHRYISDLKEKIARGYYFSDTILGKVVEEIAPVIDESIEGEMYPALF